MRRFVQTENAECAGSRVWVKGTFLPFSLVTNLSGWWCPALPRAGRAAAHATDLRGHRNILHVGRLFLTAGWFLATTAVGTCIAHVHRTLLLRRETEGKGEGRREQVGGRREQGERRGETGEERGKGLGKRAWGERRREKPKREILNICRSTA